MYVCVCVCVCVCACVCACVCVSVVLINYNTFKMSMNYSSTITNENWPIMSTFCIKTKTLLVSLLTSHTITKSDHYYQTKTTVVCVCASVYMYIISHIIRHVIKMAVVPLVPKSLSRS